MNGCCPFASVCAPTLPCGRPCDYCCREQPLCCRPFCPPPCPCTPCPPCRCCPMFRQAPEPLVPDYVPPILPILPICKPRRIPERLPPPEPPTPTLYNPPALPCLPPPPPCPHPPVIPRVLPIPCYQPVLPRCNPQCPPPIVPKQRPICPRAIPCPMPCLPVAQRPCPCNCASGCECRVADPDLLRRPLIVHNSVYAERPTGLPAHCKNMRNPSVRYSCTYDVTFQRPRTTDHVCVPLI